MGVPQASGVEGGCRGFGGTATEGAPKGIFGTTARRLTETDSADVNLRSVRVASIRVMRIRTYRIDNYVRRGDLYA